ncbi:MAG: nucleotidyltransferase domain-containing protein [Ktedonobacterales bacterium]
MTETSDPDDPSGLPDAWLQQLVDALDAPGVVGVALGGSFARGDATALSDLDLAPFYGDGVTLPYKRLFYSEGRLVSVSPKSVTAWQAQMRRPESAIYLVSSATQLRILRDHDGVLAALVTGARAFEWQPLQAAADRFASDLLLLEAEHAQKLLAALLAGDESSLCRALDGLLHALPWLVATQRGMLVTSGNTFFAQVQQATGPESAWARTLRAALGIGAPSSLRARGEATLRLYAETARLLGDALRPDDATTIHAFIALAAKHGYPA